MEKYRKKPVVIEAVQLTKATRATVVSQIVGEFYPCKPDIFKKTYEKVV